MGAVLRILGMAVGAAVVDILATAINPILGILFIIGTIVWIVQMIVDIITKIT